MLDKVLIVIVLYKSKLEDSSTFRTLRASLRHFSLKVDLYVYDNSPSVRPDVQFPEFNIIYNVDGSNSGLSKAYNAAAAYGKNNRKEWLLLFDQDSNLPADYIEVMLKSVTKYSTHSFFVPILKQHELILSPCKFRFMKGSALRSIGYGPMNFLNVSVFNSGILVRLKLFYEAGGYNEQIQLDFSDHYFVSQVKKVENELVVLPIVIQHELSSHTNDEEKITSRFSQYCVGVRAYGKAKGGAPLLFLWTFLRAVKLSFTYKKPIFITLFFGNYFSRTESETKTEKWQ